MKIIVRLFVLLVVTVFMGCATAGGGSSAGGPSAAGLSDADLKRMGISETYEKRK